MAAGAAAPAEASAIESLPHDTVVSSDGSVELLVPAGALPAGTAAADIKVTDVMPGADGFTADGARPWKQITLEPDGLVLARPALLRFSGGRDPDGRTPLLLIESGGEPPVPLESSGVEVEADGTVSHWAEINHFSTIRVLLDGAFRFTMDEMGSRTVGVPFELKVTGTQDSSTIKMESAGGGGDLMVERPWRLESPVWRGALSVQLQKETHPGTDVDDVIVRDRGQFSCVRAGTAEVRWEGHIRVPWRTPPGWFGKLFTSTGSYTQSVKLISLGTCVAAPVPTPTPTPVSRPLDPTELARLLEFSGKTPLAPVASPPAAASPDALLASIPGLEIGPLTATYKAFLHRTDYFINVHGADEAQVTYKWSGFDCGTWEQSDTAPWRLRWEHPHPPCTGPEDHPSVTVKVEVTLKGQTVIRTYKGAATGQGPDR